MQQSRQYFRTDVLVNRAHNFFQKQPLEAAGKLMVAQRLDGSLPQILMLH